MNREDLYLLRKIKETRRKMGISQDKFARLCGVTIQTVFRWEHGISHPSPLARPKLDRILRSKE